MAESLYTRRVAQGLCGMCGKQPIDPQSKGLCTSHLASSKAKAAAKRQTKMASGECLWSGCHEPAVGGRYCKEHASRQKQDMADKYADRKAAGQCVGSTGCTNPVKPGCTMCQQHIDERTEVSLQHYNRRKAAGLCCYCNNPPMPGKHACAYHLEKQRDRNFQIKVSAFEAYGGVSCAAADCAVIDPDMLSLHHIDHDGAIERNTLGNKGGTEFYQHLKNNGYPDRHRYCVLCHNHNGKAEFLRRDGRTLKLATKP